MAVKNEEKSAGITMDDLGISLPPMTEHDTDYIEEAEIIEEEHIEAPVNDDIEYTPKDDSEQYRGALSRDGEEFDPSIHKIPPSETKTGKWRKRTRKKGEPEQAQNIDSNAVMKQAALNTAVNYAHLHTLIYGEGGTLKKQSDVLQLTQAIERYYIAEGVKELPPKIGLLLACSGYSFSVALREENKSKTVAIVSVIKKPFILLKEKIFGKKKVKPQPETKPVLQAEKEEEVQQDGVRL